MTGPHVQRDIRPLWMIKKNNEQALITRMCVLWASIIYKESRCVFVLHTAELGEMQHAFVFIIACLQNK